MVEQPIQWTKNRYKKTFTADSNLEEKLLAELPQMIRRFHRQLPGYRMSLLKSLSSLATKLGLGGIWVKNESARLDLQSFKVLGDSYASTSSYKSVWGWKTMNCFLRISQTRRCGISWAT